MVQPEMINPLGPKAAGQPKFSGSGAGMQPVGKVGLPNPACPDNGWGHNPWVRPIPPIYPPPWVGPVPPIYPPWGCPVPPWARPIPPIYPPPWDWQIPPWVQPIPPIYPPGVVPYQ
jgi:hypothetical protein